MAGGILMDTAPNTDDGGAMSTSSRASAGVTAVAFVALVPVTFVIFLVLVVGGAARQSGGWLLATAVLAVPGVAVIGWRLRGHGAPVLLASRASPASTVDVPIT